MIIEIHVLSFRSLALNGKMNANGEETLEELQCPVCKTSYPNLETFMSHMNTHLVDKLRDESYADACQIYVKEEIIEEPEIVIANVQSIRNSESNLNTANDLNENDPLDIGESSKVRRVGTRIGLRKRTHEKPKEFDVNGPKKSVSQSIKKLVKNRSKKLVKNQSKKLDKRRKCSMPEIKKCYVRLERLQIEKIDITKDKAKKNSLGSGKVEKSDALKKLEQLKIKSNLSYEILPKKSDQLICKYCNKSSFTSVGGLKIHVSEVHEKDRNFKCEKCSRAFVRKGDLKAHVNAVHEKRKDFKCEICQKAFFRNNYLQTHVNTVHKNVSIVMFQCNMCKKTFTSNSHLKDHVTAVHERAKEFKCEICNKVFKCKSHLKEHVIAVHEKRKDFKCEICNKAFSLKKVLTKHVNVVHKNVSNFMCRICNKAFQGSADLFRHNAALHKNE